MKWAHLPEPGGLYAQNPDLLDRFYYIIAERSREQEKQQKKQQQKSGANTSRSGVGRGRRSH